MNTTRALALLVSLGATAALVACGGGGGASTTALAVTGVAATGAPIVNGTVTVQCAAGNPSTTATGADGSYVVEVINGTLPCLVTVTQGAITLRSVSTQPVINVTPVTDAIVKAVAAAKGATNVNQLVTVGTQATVTPTDLNAAQVALRAAIQQATGVTLPSTDLISGPLVAATSTTQGNAYDQALDALRARGAVTATGVVAPAVQQAVTAQTSQVVRPTGTGG